MQCTFCNETIDIWMVPCGVYSCAGHHMLCKECRAKLNGRCNVCGGRTCFVAMNFDPSKDKATLTSAVVVKEVELKPHNISMPTNFGSSSIEACQQVGVSAVSLNRGKLSAGVNELTDNANILEHAGKTSRISLAEDFFSSGGSSHDDLTQDGAKPYSIKSHNHEATSNVQEKAEKYREQKAACNSYFNTNRMVDIIVKKFEDRMDLCDPSERCESGGRTVMRSVAASTDSKPHLKPSEPLSVKHSPHYCFIQQADHEVRPVKKFKTEEVLGSLHENSCQPRTSAKSSLKDVGCVAKSVEANELPLQKAKPAEKIPDRAVESIECRVGFFSTRGKVPAKPLMVNASDIPSAPIKCPDSLCHNAIFIRELTSHVMKKHSNVPVEDIETGQVKNFFLDTKTMHSGVTTLNVMYTLRGKLKGVGYGPYKDLVPLVLMSTLMPMQKVCGLKRDERNNKHETKDKEMSILVVWITGSVPAYILVPLRLSAISRQAPTFKLTIYGSVYPISCSQGGKDVLQYCGALKLTDVQVAQLTHDGADKLQLQLTVQ